ncbi:MAG: 2-dehydro-3-deoxygalactonokinase [Clostridia bacterium]|nr:2-dehydro-3-deoxygalactonokinase [Clostridia bacterium]
MANYITIDGGTTNTRISLVKCGEIVDTVKLNVGARSGIDENSLLKAEIKKGIIQLLNKNKLSDNEIDRILASGMITSEFGICKLDHIVAPAGIIELNQTKHETVLEEVSGIPFVFIRGVKTSGEKLCECDVMRGEETELMGIITSGDGKCIYVLPGSHSKIIYTDENGRITKFVTMLTGEMIFSLTNSTILKDAVDLSIVNTNTQYLQTGFEYCKDKGINEALFKTRILKNIYNCTAEQIYSFFLGVVLCAEILQIIKSDIKKVVIGGKAQIKNAMAELLRRNSDKMVVCLSEEEVNKSTSMGMIKIYELNK